jgi:CubicO group peptidase (beta-lactamase class C family)
MAVVPKAAEADGRVLEEFGRGLENLRQQLRIPGMAAGVVKDRRLIWAKGFGFADVEKGIEASPSTPWHIASVTKTFAAVILLQLVEEGKLGLDDPLEKFGIAVKSRGTVRVRHILTHTSEKAPGTFFRYSGRRWEHLARVIQEASGKPFKDLIVERISRRLGLSDTAPNRESASEAYPFEDIRKRASVFYGMDEAFRPKRQELVLGFYAAGGLFSSVRDMAVYDAAIDGDVLLKPETRALMFAPHVSEAGHVLPHGLGWFCQDLHGTRLVWHFGWHPDHASALMVKVPEEGLSFLLFANSDKLSQPFNLLHGDLLNSPAALLFLKTFVARGEALAEIADREAVTEDISLKAGGWKPAASGAQKAFLICCRLAFLSAPLVWTAGWVARKHRAKDGGRELLGEGRGIVFIRIYALFVMALCVLMMAALQEAPFLMYWPELPGWIDGISLAENVVLALPTLLSALSFGWLLLTAFVWTRQAGSLVSRLHDTFLAAFTIGFTALLDHWHLVGISYYWEYLLK